MSISLVYLCRGKDAGLHAANVFIEHYSKNDPGCKHELIVVFKGWDKNQEKEKKELNSRFQSLNARLIELEDDGFDWGAYIRVTPMIETDFICFLNSFSRPLSNFWLKNMYECIRSDGVGMCGATAAYKAWRFSLPFFEMRLSSIFTYLLKIFRRLINHFLLLGYYPSQFCPHLRSNGFVVERKRFEDFISLKTIPKTKRDCYRLESGTGSISNYVTEKNEKLVLVDKNGKKFDVKDWISSKTYYYPGQPGLCVADNNTDHYDRQNITKKRQMEFDAWGSIFNY